MGSPPRLTVAKMKEAVEALNAHRGNQLKAALSIGLSRQALQNRLAQAQHRGLCEAGLVPSIKAKPTPPIPEPVKPFAAENAPPPSYTGGHAIELVSDKNNQFIFGAAGDLHAASKYTRWDVREELYEWFANEGASCNFDTGNWIDGDASFNRYDLEVSGLDRQIKLLAKRHPKHVPTYAVWGDDHEGWYVQREGVDVGAYAEHVMQEAGHKWVNLGFMEASVALKNKNSGKVATMAVVHPGGGSAYAISYAIQKIIESLDGGEKPAIGIYGHYHKLWSGIIRNVWVAQTGCGQDQTPFMRKKRLEAHVGGCLIKLTQDPRTGAIIRMQCEIARYFNRGYYNNRWSKHGDVVLPKRTKW